MYREESDANPIDTFDLNPAETDVTVHSAISSAELPNTASTDLPYVLKLEHEPLTTCWPRRFGYYYHCHRIFVVFIVDCVPCYSTT